VFGVTLVCKCEAQVLLITEQHVFQRRFGQQEILFFMTGILTNQNFYVLCFSILFSFSRKTKALYM